MDYRFGIGTHTFGIVINYFRLPNNLGFDEFTDPDQSDLEESSFSWRSPPYKIEVVNPCAGTIISSPSQLKQSYSLAASNVVTTAEAGGPVVRVPLSTITEPDNNGNSLVSADYNSFGWPWTDDIS